MYMDIIFSEFTVSDYYKHSVAVIHEWRSTIFSVVWFCWTSASLLAAIKLMNKQIKL